MTLPKGVIKKCESQCQNNFSEPGTYRVFFSLFLTFSFLCGFSLPLSTYTQYWSKVKQVMLIILLSDFSASIDPLSCGYVGALQTKYGLYIPDIYEVIIFHSQVRRGRDVLKIL